MAAHDAAKENSTFLVSLSVKHHAGGETGAHFIFTQRAEIIRDPLWQHRHHPVGKIG